MSAPDATDGPRPDRASGGPPVGTAERLAAQMASPAERTGPPRTGDIVVDAALADLAAADPADPEAQLTAGEQVQRTLHGRLSDLGG